ncbi:MAG: YMGG-like glycine zipper-containing protein [Campylobacterota bacterium]|nr:YMGG-like glycine zipper-containing protein [Campylobacterota bacterium]
MKRIIMLPIAVALIANFTGCAQPDMSDSQRTKAEGTGIGVLGGALLGAAFGGKKGAAWGAALGGVAGYAYGSHVANEKAKYVRQEDWLNACIASAQKVNNKTRSYNAKLSKKIADTKRLVRLYKQNKATKSQMRAQKQMIDRERKTANQMLKNAQNELNAQQKVLSDARKMGKKAEARRLEQQISILKKENRVLKSQTNTLASLSALTAV